MAETDFDNEQILIDIYSSMYSKGMPQSISVTDDDVMYEDYYRLKLTFSSSANVSTNKITVILKKLRNYTSYSINDL